MLTTVHELNWRCLNTGYGSLIACYVRNLHARMMGLRMFNEIRNGSKIIGHCPLTNAIESESGLRNLYMFSSLQPMAARSKTWVRGRSPAETVDSNPTGNMDSCLLWVLCVVRYRSLRRASHSSRGVLPNVVCRCLMGILICKGLTARRFYRLFGFKGLKLNAKIKPLRTMLHAEIV
jgi:hypothetical protein